MSDDLKPCPFCGGMAEGNNPPMRQVVQCNDCGATVVGKKAWNTRAANEALQVVLDKTEEDIRSASADAYWMGFQDRIEALQVEIDAAVLAEREANAARLDDMAEVEMGVGKITHAAILECAASIIRARSNKEPGQ